MPTISIVSPSGSNANKEAHLFASAEGLDPDKSYKVHWELGTGSGSADFDSNDRPVATLADDNTKGNNWGSKITGSDGDQIILNAQLFLSTDDVTSAPPLHEAGRNVTLYDLPGTNMLGAAATTPVTGKGDEPADGNYSIWQVVVKDKNDTTVDDVDVMWQVSPSMLGLTFWDPHAGGAPSELPTVQVAPDVFYAYSKSVSGKASAWVMADRAYELQALPKVNMEDLSLVDTVYFASANYGSPNSNLLSGGELIPSDIRSFKWGSYITLHPTESSFTASLPGGWPNESDGLDSKASYFFVVNNSVGGQDGTLSSISSPTLSYNYLNPSIKTLESAPSPADENYLTLFVQNPDGTVYNTKPRMFYAYGEGAENRPPEVPTDGARNPDGDLPQATILYLADGNITLDTLTYGGNALKVHLKQIASHHGKTIHFLFYMNGYKEGTTDLRAEGPTNPKYVKTAVISDSGATGTELKSKWSAGFSGYRGNMKTSYVDYYIEDPAGTKIYGPYPTVSAKTNT